MSYFYSSNVTSRAFTVYFVIDGADEEDIKEIKNRNSKISEEEINYFLQFRIS